MGVHISEKSLYYEVKIVHLTVVSCNSIREVELLWGISLINLLGLIEKALLPVWRIHLAQELNICLISLLTDWDSKMMRIQ